MARREETDPRSDSEKLLEFLAAVSVLPKDATEPTHISAAARVGLSISQVSRIFGKTSNGAKKALQRARKSKAVPGQRRS
jgi:DNA-directed RNA polymerase specialized sigma24 family protein